MGADVNTVTQALAELGPMTNKEIVEHTGMGMTSVSTVICRMRRPTQRSGRRAHIAGWAMVVEAGRKYPRPIFDLGDKPDKKQPPRKTRKQVNKDRRDRARTLSTKNFVFNLGSLMNRRNQASTAA